MPEQWHRPGVEEFTAAYSDAFEESSIESLICHAVLLEPTGWELAAIERSVLHRYGVFRGGEEIGSNLLPGYTSGRFVGLTYGGKL